MLLLRLWLLCLMERGEINQLYFWDLVFWTSFKGPLFSQKLWPEPDHEWERSGSLNLGWLCRKYHTVQHAQVRENPICFWQLYKAAATRLLLTWCGPFSTPDDPESMCCKFCIKWTEWMADGSLWLSASYFWVSLAELHWSLRPLLCLSEFWLVLTGTGGRSHRAPSAVLPGKTQKKLLKA